MKKMEIFVIAIIITTLISTKVLGVPIFVNIRDTLEGHFPYYNITQHNGVIEIKAMWENLGSVTCDAYLRVDVLDNESNVIDTFWSNPQEIAPGDSGIFNVYIYLQNYSGNITLRQRYYYCNEISRLKERNMSYNSTAVMPGRGNLTLRYEIVNNTYIKLYIHLNSTVNGTAYILPEKTPIGWVVESKKIDIINGKGEGDIYIIKPKKSKESLSFYVLTPSSNISSRNIEVYEKKIKLIKEEKEKKEGLDWFKISILINILLSLMLVALLIYIHTHRKSGDNEKRKKKKDDRGRR